VAKELRHVDISNMPELLKLAEEVGASKEPRVLRRDDEDLAVLMPVRKHPTPPSRAKPLTKDDPLFGLIGIGRSDVGYISANKHEFLAQAYSKNHT